jgi:YggT family protein
MLRETLVYVLETVVNLFSLAALMRFYAQAFRASFRNPIAQFIVALTDWAVKPLRRILPSVMGLDTASFMVAWLTLILLWWALLMIMQLAEMTHPLFWPGLLALSVVKLVKLSIYLLIGIVLVQAVLSWVSPYHPMRPFFETMSKPFLQPLRRIVPLVGGVDLSPLLLLILLQILLMLPIVFLEQESFRLMRGLALL